MILTPLIIGIFFGPLAVAGFLIGNIINGTQLAISSSNSGGAWDNTKKSIKNKGIKLKGMNRITTKIKDLTSILVKLDSEKKDIENEIENEMNSNNDNKQMSSLSKLKNSIINSIHKYSLQLEHFKELEIRLSVLIKNNNNEYPKEIDEETAFTTSDEDVEARSEEIINRNLIKELYIVEVIKSRKYKSYRNAEKSSIVGDTVGDPLKDTSGPSLKILIKLSAIFSLIFGELMVNTNIFKDVFENIGE